MNSESEMSDGSEESTGFEPQDDLNPLVEKSDDHWLGKLSIAGLLSWFVIVSITCLLCWLASSVSIDPGEVGGNSTPIELYPVQMQGKILVGQKSLSSIAGNEEAAKESMATAIESIDTGSYDQRLSVAILKNEVDGPTAGLDYLEELDKKVKEHSLELTDEQQNLRRILVRTFEEYESGNLDSEFLSDKDKSLLTGRLQWLGELALLPEGTSQKNERAKLVGGSTNLMVGMTVFVLIGALLLCAGFVVGIILFILAVQKKLKTGFLNGPTNHNIYVETFAIWMFLFSVFSKRSGFLFLIPEP